MENLEDILGQDYLNEKYLLEEFKKFFNITYKDLNNKSPSWLRKKVETYNISLEGFNFNYMDYVNVNLKNNTELLLLMIKYILNISDSDIIYKNEQYFKSKIREFKIKTICDE